MLIPISSPDDPRIAPYRDLKDNAIARDDGFIVEGRIALTRLIDGSRFSPVSLLLGENRVASLAPLLDRLEPHIPVHIAAQPVLDAIAGFHLHRGVLALARRTPSPSAASLLSDIGVGERTVLALAGLANTDNVGACFRNAAAFGADAVLLDKTCCDPLYRKAIRVASGLSLSLPFAHMGDATEMLDALDGAGFETWALSPVGGEPLPSITVPPRVALLLGAEGPGLPEHILGRARRVFIPMAPGVDSLNVATAGAIALAHVFAQRSAG